MRRCVMGRLRRTRSGGRSRTHHHASRQAPDALEQSRNPGLLARGRFVLSVQPTASGPRGGFRHRAAHQSCLRATSRTPAKSWVAPLAGGVRQLHGNPRYQHRRDLRGIARPRSLPVVSLGIFELSSRKDRAWESPSPDPFDARWFTGLDALHLRLRHRVSTEPGGIGPVDEAGRVERPRRWDLASRRTLRGRERPETGGPRSTGSSGRIVIASYPQVRAHPEDATGSMRR